MRTWIDGLHEALAAGPRAGQARALFARYRDAFPLDYREVYPPATAVADIGVIEALTAERPLGVEFYRNARRRAGSAGLKVFSHGRPIPLSERVPVLENMGFRVVDERTYHIEPQGRRRMSGSTTWCWKARRASRSSSRRSRSGWRPASSR